VPSPQLEKTCYLIYVFSRPFSIKAPGEASGKNGRKQLNRAGMIRVTAIEATGSPKDVDVIQAARVFSISFL
jgi:hypothetical protein